MVYRRLEDQELFAIGYAFCQIYLHQSGHFLAGISFVHSTLKGRHNIIIIIIIIIAKHKNAKLNDVTRSQIFSRQMQHAI
jgi:hypothetical protein